jgi:hypothetical protein
MQRQQPIRTDKDGSDSEGDTLLVNISLVEVVEHAVEGRDLSALVGDDREVELGSLGVQVVNVLDPAGVRVDVIGRETDQLEVSGTLWDSWKCPAVSVGSGSHLDASGLEVGVGEGDGRELGGADGGLGLVCNRGVWPGLRWVREGQVRLSHI